MNIRALTSFICPLGISLGLLNGCGSEPPAPSGQATDVEEREGVAGTPGIAVTIGDSVEFTSKTVTAAGQLTVKEQLVNGLPYSLEGTALRIGNMELQLAAGDTVLLSWEGVFVNGQHRADLPTE